MLCFLHHFKWFKKWLSSGNFFVLSKPGFRFKLSIRFRSIPKLPGISGDETIQGFKPQQVHSVWMEY